ncbi:XRN 5'-3' exonuclease N-terminus-domain-containing protein, partial [Pavlovales sp. CCMP2436]
MGVPAFFKWLRRRFPKAVWEVAETEDALRAEQGDVDWRGANPAGFEVDNLYLDMNGVIHACTHPQDRPAPPDEAAMMAEICVYVDKLAVLARPRRLLFLAIDGVAPRAKMNQQRARRFLAAKEAGMRVGARKKAADEWRALGIAMPKPEGAGAEEGALPASFDHTVITPGTVFMEKVSEALHAYVCARLASHPAWRELTVVLSDAAVAGEGEHKIMEYVRAARASEGYDAAQTHCVYGLDADLVLLGLAAHEPRWVLLRDRDADAHLLEAPRIAHLLEAPRIAHRPFLWLSLWVLREYLEHALRPSAARLPPLRSPSAAGLDDLVALSFLAGNDFLPHLPGLEVHAGGMDELLRALARARAQAEADGDTACARGDAFAAAEAEAAGGPLLVRGELQRAPLTAVLLQLSAHEGRMLERARERGLRADSARARNKRPTFAKAADVSAGAAAFDAAAFDRAVEAQLDGEVAREIKARAEGAAADAAAADAASADKAAGARAKWYATTLGSEFVATPGAVRQLAREYVRGLAWVAGYYYRGAPAWMWYYPAHYAPYATDLAEALHEMGDADFAALAGAASFELGRPLPPLTQLMTVMPPASAHCVPAAYRPLLELAASPLARMYPRDFSMDLRGCTALWQGVAKLPFVDISALQTELSRADGGLDEGERARNLPRRARVY